uniref:Zona pellucida sperm-binding protein 1 n=1 Tax=Sphenodon punctatus TaxID=8508 RepID=A0A8D0HX05_SPHPU
VGGGRGVSLVLLVSMGLAHGQRDLLQISFSVLPHRYDCGNYGMQLLTFPSQGRTIRFKVVDEFGTPFEVTNCSICRHWITSGEEGAVIFSAGYNGCHVLKKVRPGIHVLSTAAVIAVPVEFCIWPNEHLPTPEENLRHVPQPGLVRPAPHALYRVWGGHLVSFSNLLHLLACLALPGTHLTQEQCQVSSAKIPCADARGQAACSKAGCCYDETDLAAPCYYGNTVTIQCLRNGQFILVVSRDMADYPIILDSVRLAYAQGGCNPISATEAFVVFQFSLTQCGTTVQVTGNKLIYENQLISGIDIRTGPYGSITRDSTFILHARCIYNASDFLPVQAEVILPPAPALVAQVGPLRLELRIATDPSYSAYYTDGDYPVVKVLRDPVNVEVRILERTDPSLVLILHRCWATPSVNPLAQPQWPILVDGCPFQGDNYRTQLVPLWPATSELPFPTHYQRFVVSTFAFVDSASQMVLDGLVYLFCSASACHPSQLEPCRTTCPAGAAAASKH